MTTDKSRTTPYETATTYIHHIITATHLGLVQSLQLDYYYQTLIVDGHEISIFNGPVGYDAFSWSRSHSGSKRPHGTD
jgi:hypothetical protein